MINNEKKSSLALTAPVGWDVISFEDNEYVMCQHSGERMIFAKVRLVPYSGSEEDLRGVFYNRISSTAIIVDFRHYDFIYENIKWIADSYVCENSSEKYRSLYYAVLDNCYLVIEMMTASNQSVLRFTNEAKSLIHSVDYSSINQINRVRVDEKIFKVKTPSSFRFSSSSTEDTLVFFGETGYLLVNVIKEKQSLLDFVNESIENTIDGIDLTISVSEHELEGDWEVVQYEIVSDKVVAGTGTYFKQEAAGQSIVSYLYENGRSTINPRNLLDFVEEAS